LPWYSDRTVLCADKDFEPREQESSDDEETIDKDESDNKTVSSQ